MDPFSCLYDRRDCGAGAGVCRSIRQFFPSLSIDSYILNKNIKIFHTSIHISLSAGQFVGIAVILLLSFFNYIGVIFGKFIQNILTVIKIGVVTVIIFLGFALGHGTAPNLALNPGGWSFGQMILGFGMALVAVTWAFDGWNNVNFIAGEIKNPERNLPRALILGTLGVTVLYVLINYIYLYALPMNKIIGEVKIVEKATSALFGGSIGALISAVILISIFGAINGSILVGPRVYYAMARDKLFFSKASEVHPRFKTPGFAIIIQGIWASILTLAGTFEQLFTFAMFIAIAFWIAAALSVFTLRKKFPDLPPSL